MSVPAQEALDARRRFRDAMGRFATGVTVITTAVENTVHGMTANGFMSVSLEPQIVVVSVAEKARMCELLQQSGRYGVSVLSDQQRHLSSHFAGRPQEAPIPFLDAGGVPVIKGALTQLVATVISTVSAGDHRLFLGEVTFLEYEAGSPLIFHGGDFRALAHPSEFTARWEHMSDWV